MFKKKQKAQLEDTNKEIANQTAQANVLNSQLVDSIERMIKEQETTNAELRSLYTMLENYISSKME